MMPLALKGGLGLSTITGLPWYELVAASLFVFETVRSSKTFVYSFQSLLGISLAVLALLIMAYGRNSFLSLAILAFAITLLVSDYSSTNEAVLPAKKWDWIVLVFAIIGIFV